MPIDPHLHNGIDSPRVNAKDIIGPSLITADAVSGVSAIRSIQPTVVQRGFYTLASGVKLVVFPEPYSETTTLHVLLTAANTANATHTLQGIVTSAFTVSGSGSETGHWVSFGYK